jgi:GDPmannose 4,6-dehydratase
MEKTALITGVTGQDGAYLSKLLLKNGYKVIGLIRPKISEDFSKLSYLEIKDKISYIPCNLLDSENTKNILSRYNPGEVYNLASQSSVIDSWNIPRDTLQFNIMSVENILECIRHTNKKIRFFQASSCEMFGNSNELPSTEKTPLRPLNFYATSKAAAHWIVNHYRSHYNLFACSGILFHHESYLRGNKFFVKKIVRESVEIAQGFRKSLIVGNIEVERDLGYAPCYVEAMWAMLNANQPDDFIISSGKSISLKQVIYHVFDKLRINQNKIVIDKNIFRPADIQKTCGNNQKAKDVLEWKYEMDFYDVLDILIEEEFKNLVESRGKVELNENIKQTQDCSSYNP